MVRTAYANSIAYALPVTLTEPLLFKGADFAAPDGPRA
jgi:hypothetical protein